MTYKQVETSREIRLWITGILGPIIMGGATLIANDPDLKAALWSKVKTKVNLIKKKLH